MAFKLTGIICRDEQPNMKMIDSVSNFRHSPATTESRRQMRRYTSAKSCLWREKKVTGSCGVSFKLLGFSFIQVFELNSSEHEDRLRIKCRVVELGENCKRKKTSSVCPDPVARISLNLGDDDASMSLTIITINTSNRSAN